MKIRNYLQEQNCVSKISEIYRLRNVEGLSVADIIKKMECSRSAVYRALTIFESANPQIAESMKKKGKSVTPEDYKQLLAEIAQLKKELAQARLRGDLYAEMVEFGKEVYGIDLKKAGTK